jgi:hypothetical protein
MNISEFFHRLGASSIGTRLKFRITQAEDVFQLDWLRSSKLSLFFPWEYRLGCEWPWEFHDRID